MLNSPSKYTMWYLYMIATWRKSHTQLSKQKLSLLRSLIESLMRGKNRKQLFPIKSDGWQEREFMYRWPLFSGFA